MKIPVIVIVCFVMGLNMIGFCRGWKAAAKKNEDIYGKIIDAEGSGVPWIVAGMALTFLLRWMGAIDW